MKKKQIYLIALFLSFAAISCTKSTLQQTGEFVSDYNAAASSQINSFYGRFSDNIIMQTYAETFPSEENQNRLDIKIVLRSKFKRDDPEIEQYKDIVPASFFYVIKKDKRASYLIRNGVKFRVVYCSRNDRVISDLIIDKAKMLELSQQKPELEIAKAKNNNSISADVKQILIALNNSLPIVIDHELQIKMTKVDVNKLNELEYSLEIGDEMTERIKSDAAKELLKENILRNPNTRQLFMKVKSIGLSNIKYIYKDKTGKKLNEVLITESDL
ncbi:MAG: hypothetical protein EOP00_09995 [Pedobacter sp.]|nr:MAG: hypothetical protein EOP00_09995 [Pedobacter sp.]